MLHFIPTNERTNSIRLSLSLSFSLSLSLSVSLNIRLHQIFLFPRIIKKISFVSLSLLYYSTPPFFHPIPPISFLLYSYTHHKHTQTNKRYAKSSFLVVCLDGTYTTLHYNYIVPTKNSLTKKEQKLLAKINRAYYLPEWCSVQDYVDLFEQQGATDIKRDDWSYVIAPFWKAVIRSSFSVRSIIGLIKSGPTTIRGAYAMLLMLRGFNTGLIKFGLITCTKPSSTTSSSTATSTIPATTDNDNKE